MTTHGLCQACDDRESQTAAAKAPGHGRIGLREAGKNDRDLVSWDADSCISDGEMKQARVLAVATYSDRHSSVIGKFNRVPNKIDENLADAQRVTYPFV
jgi:hypothetical protein